MPALRYFRSTLVTLSLVAFLASVMFLVSSAPMEPAAMDQAMPEPPVMDQIVNEPLAGDPMSAELVNPSAEPIGPPVVPSLEQLAELQGAVAEMVSYRPPVGTLESPFAGVPVVLSPSGDPSPAQPTVQSV
ncbi:MAG: hypothetical protein ABIJ86_13745, partial [Spirochaetota bacterium]